MTKLSVNINKIATIRNARGGNIPDVREAAIKIQAFGAEGITVHPRPDERHIRYSDVYAIKPIITTEFNIEGNPIDKFMELVLDVCPTQATLVPDGPDAITSNAGWDTIKNKDFLTSICARLREKGIRSSIFVDPVPEMVFGAKECGADRVELYTEAYARLYEEKSPAEAIAPYIEAAKAARQAGLGLNAGHDLSLVNLEYFIRNIPWCDEVSIGHALISDALWLGLEKTIVKYLKQTRCY
ncbi:MAG: pyridoxine 5'-phosphate synthase [Bacteroidales bacterium]|nr:pyridoxine 5'-phosphate synthase [Bacteroidales bacterium]